MATEFVKGDNLHLPSRIYLGPGISIRQDGTGRTWMESGTSASESLPTGGIAALEAVIDERPVGITTGVKGRLQVPFPCVITEALLVANTSGSIVVDLWKGGFSDLPLSAANSICGSALPTLTSALKYQDTTLTGWTTFVDAGEWIYYNVQSVAGLQEVTVVLVLEA